MGGSTISYLGGSTVNAPSPALVRQAVVTAASCAAAVGENVPFDTTSNSIAVTLPAAPADKSQWYGKMIAGTGLVTITTSESDVFNKAGGATAITLSLLNQGALLQYDEESAIWTVLADDLALGQLDGRYAHQTYGITPANFPNWRKAVAEAVAGTAAAKVLFIGTSITAGQPNTTDPGLYGVPAYLASILNSELCPSQLSFYGVSPGPVDATNPDSRWSVGSGWTFNSGLTGGGGWADAGYVKGVGASGTLSYAPGNGEVDTFDIWYIGTSLTGNLKAQVDSGTVDTITTTQATSGIYKATVTCARGTGHTLNLSITGAGVIAFIVGIDAYDSTQEGLRVGNAGVPLIGTSGGWATTNGAYKSLEAIKAYAPALTIVELGADDASNNNSVANFLTNLAAIVAACKVSGDVLFWTTPVCSTAIGSPAGNTAANEALYNAAVIQYAQQNGCGVVDVAARFGPWATWSAAALNYDSIHPSPLGNQDIASAIFDPLRSVAFGAYGQSKQGAGTLPTAAEVGAAESLVPTAVKVANYTAVPTDFVPCNVSGGSFTVTLPTAPADGSRVGIKVVATASTNVANIATGGSDVLNIAGATTGSLSLLNQGVVFVYKASTAIWYAESTDAPLSQLDARYLLQAHLGEGYGVTGDTGGSTPAPAVALSTASGSIGSDVSLTPSATTKVFDTASLAVGTWIIFGSVLVEYVAASAATLEGNLAVDTGAATITGLLGGEVETNSAVITQAMPFAAVVVVTSAATLKYQIKNNSSTDTPLAKAASSGSFTSGTTGYSALRAA